MGWALELFSFISILVITMAGESSAEETGGLAGASLNLGPRDCPCDHIFTMLETTADGRRVQNSNVQERGEPKSGTSFMSVWVRGALDGTCQFLRRTYGQDTCHYELTGPRNLNMNFTFDPKRGNDDSACTCNDVDLVQIYYREDDKHSMPVSNECRWSHVPGIDIHGGCKTLGGRTVENYADLWGCVQEAGCEITDGRIQFVPMRDPRGIAVSTYFHLIRYYPRTLRKGQTLHEAVIEFLPVICQWIAIRHILAEGIMPEQSHVFWYEEANEHMLEWHFRLLASFGLQLPVSVVSRMVELASHVGGYNVHSGGMAPVAKRTWRDEIPSDMGSEMDEILRTWLPPVILARLGVPPAF